MTFLAGLRVWCPNYKRAPKQVEESKAGKSLKEGGTGMRAAVASKRLDNEFKQLSSVDNIPTHCCYGPVDEHDPSHLQAVIIGPSDTPFDGGIFFLNIRIPHDYPFKPPQIKFQTKVFHPNVTSDGTIHIDILKNRWTPALTINTLLLSICSFLPDPSHEPDSCNSVCHLYSHHRNLYDKIAREWTYKYAML